MDRRKLALQRCPPLLNAEELLPASQRKYGEEESEEKLFLTIFNVLAQFRGFDSHIGLFEDTNYLPFFFG